MPPIPAWYHRKFDFTYPADLYPNFIVRLRGPPARLEEILRAAAPDRRTRPESEGKWSAQEHAGHMLNLEPLWAARVEDFVAGRTDLTVADLTNRPTFDARYNDWPLDRILSAFRDARTKMADRLNQLDPPLFSRSVIHPRMKVPMRLTDHLFFVAEHDDHHLAIIWNLLR